MTIASTHHETLSPPLDSSDIGAKGRRTRAQLVAAARQVFADQGYFNSRLSDITDLVGCSTGTLYTYFRNREDILAAVIEEAQQNVLRATPVTDADSDPVERIHRANREYIDSYCENADLMAVMEQVSHVDPNIKKVRTQRSNAFIERNARSIAKLQRQGIVDSSLNPKLISQALSSMVSRLCYHLYVDEKDPTYVTDEGRAELIRTVSFLWVDALGLSTPHDRTPQAAENQATGDEDTREQN